MNCYSCGAPLREIDYGRQDSCNSCGRDTRVCRNCKNYDTAFNNHCRETSAPRVVEKEKRNFCEWFQPGSLQRDGSAKPTSAIDLKAKADALFRKK